MEISSTEAAFDAYEAVRHRLPDVVRLGAATHHETLDDIADDYDVFMLDAFGVLNIGETAIPGVPERVARLQAAGKRVMVVSNAASYPHQKLMQKYARLGYSFAPGDVISSRKALLAGLSEFDVDHWGVISVEADGIVDLGGVSGQFLQDDPAVYDNVGGVLMLGSWDWSDARQALLIESLRANPRPFLIGNPDIVAPRETGLSTEPGAYAHQFAEATGQEPSFYGKPYGNIYDLAFARLPGDIDRARVLMVGDSLHTDVLGGQAAGVHTALIAGYGFFAGADAPAAIAASGIVPDHILKRP